MADLLNRAKKFAPELNIEVGDVLTDQYGLKLAMDAQLENDRSATLLAADLRLVEGIGMAKSIDYHIVKNARESNRLILIYIYDELKDRETIYRVAPADIMNAMASRDSGLVSPTDDETVCPLCSTMMPQWHDHSVGETQGKRFEVFRHRLKYYYVPFNQIYLENLNKSAANPIEEHEEHVLDALLDAGVKVRYTGDQPGERQLFGYCPDFALYSHEGVGCRLLELGPKPAEEKRERRMKAEEMGCDVRFLEYTPNEIYRKVDQIVAEVSGWVDQSDLTRYGVADD